MSSSDPGRRLVLSAGVYIVGTFLQRGLLFLSLPIYARLFGVDDYARWSLFIALTAAFGLVFDVAWSRGIPRLYYEYWHDPALGREYLFVSFVQRLVLLAALSLAFFLLTPALLPRISGGAITFDRFGASLLIAASAESVLLFICSAYRARQRAVPFVALKLAQALAQIGGSMAAVYFASVNVERAAEVFATGSATVALVGTVLFLRWTTIRTTDAIPFTSTFRSNAAFSIPLVFHDFASWLRNAADPFIVAHFLTLYAVSIYQIGYQFGLIIGLLLYSVELALSPFLFQQMKSDPGFREKYLEVSHLIVGCTFALVVTTILFSREVIILLFPSPLAEAARIAPLVAAGYFFHGLYTVYVKPFLFYGRTELIPLLTTGPTVVGVVLSLILTPIVGVVAPAIITIVSLALLAGVVYVAARRLDPLAYPVRLHVALAIVVVAMGGTCSLLWRSESGSTLIAKATLWVVLMLVTYGLFLRGRASRMKTMIVIQPGGGAIGIMPPTHQD